MARRNTQRLSDFMTLEGCWTTLLPTQATNTAGHNTVSGSLLTSLFDLSGNARRITFQSANAPTLDTTNTIQGALFNGSKYSDALPIAANLRCFGITFQSNIALSTLSCIGTFSGYTSNPSQRPGLFLGPATGSLTGETITYLAPTNLYNATNAAVTTGSSGSVTAKHRLVMTFSATMSDVLIMLDGALVGIISNTAAVNLINVMIGKRIDFATSADFLNGYFFNAFVASTMPDLTNADVRLAIDNRMQVL